MLSWSTSRTMWNARPISQRYRIEYGRQFESEAQASRRAGGLCDFIGRDEGAATDPKPSANAATRTAGIEGMSAQRKSAIPSWSSCGRAATCTTNLVPCASIERDRNRSRARRI